MALDTGGRNGFPKGLDTVWVSNWTGCGGVENGEDWGTGTGTGMGWDCVADPNTFATICEGVMPTGGKLGCMKGIPLDTGKAGWRGGTAGTTDGGMKGAEGAGGGMKGAEAGGKGC